MLKYIVLFKARPEMARKAFRQSFAERIAPALVARLGGLDRFVVNVLDVAPGRPGQLEIPRGEETPYCDVIGEMWFDRTENAERVLAEPECILAYRVAEFVEKSEVRDDGDPPRVKLFSFIAPVVGLSDEEFRRHWDEHVPIALRAHSACRQYVRHWVEEVLPGDARPVRGVGMIAMRTLADLEQRMFDSPEGVAEVIADTAEFVGNRLVVYATEHCDLRQASGS